MEINNDYIIVIGPELKFKGTYLGKEDDYYKFLTLEVNYDVNYGGNLNIKVPATFYVNPQQISIIKKVENKDEQKSYYFDGLVVNLTEEQKQIWEEKYGNKIEEKENG